MNKEARKALKVTSCKLSHLRNSGKLEFKKKGNAYYYDSEQLLNFRNKESN